MNRKTTYSFTSSMSTPPETLPSTSATLRELSLGALLAAEHVWGQAEATIKHRVQIDPFKFGWKKDEDWEYGNHSERMYTSSKQEYHYQELWP